MSYTIKDIPFLMEELERNEKLAKQRSLEAWHKDRYSNSYAKEVNRLRKLIDLVQQPVTVDPSSNGCVLINNKFIVSLANPKWRTVGRNKWYTHRDIPHFIKNYVLKDETDETDT